MSCRLCETDARKGKKTYDDSICTVEPCLTCGDALVVWRRHGRKPTTSEQEHMKAKLLLYAGGREFNLAAGEIDTNPGEFSDHWHAHLRRPRSRGA